MRATPRLIVGGQWLRGPWEPRHRVVRKRHRQLLLLILELVEAIVDPADEQQFLVRTLLAQAALVEDENAMRVLDRAQPVRDDD